MGGLITVPADQSRAKTAPASWDIKQAKRDRVCQMLNHTLVLESPDAWGGFSTVARANLSLSERAGLAISALGALSYRDALETAAAIFGAAGDPLPPFLGGMDDARQWADWASTSELKAYALAAFEAMPAKDQAAFLHYVSAAQVAA